MLLRLALIGVMSFYGWTAYSQKYVWGTKACDELDWVEEDFRKNPNDPFAQVTYAECTFIRGKATGDEAEASSSLAMLYNLAKDSNIIANHLIAYYIVTDGDFESFGAGVDTLNDSIFYYQQVLALIELRPSYGSPMDRYSTWEYGLQMELESHLVIPFLYLNKYLWGGAGSYNQKLLNSASYKGDRDLKTYPEYREVTIDSIKKMVQFSERCMSLPYKPYFNRTFYNGVRTICERYKSLGEALLPLEKERLEEISENSCKDIQSSGCQVTSISEGIMALSDDIYEKNMATETKIYQAL